MKIFISVFAALVLCVACAGGKKEDFIGVWRATHDVAPLRGQGQGGATLIFSKDGSFQAEKVPRGMACMQSDRLLPLSGRGGWKFDESGNRILLSFVEISDKDCPPPFGISLHFELTADGYAINYFPEGMDEPVVTSFYKVAL